MHADQRAHHLSDLGLAGAERPAHHQRRFHLDTGLLEDLRPPADDPSVSVLVTSGRVVLQMRQKLRAVTFPRLDSEALPEIVVAGVGDCSWRHELDAVILTSLPVTQPVVAERNGLL